MQDDGNIVMTLNGFEVQWSIGVAIGLSMPLVTGFIPVTPPIVDWNLLIYL